MAILLPEWCTRRQHRCRVQSILISGGEAGGVAEADRMPDTRVAPHYGGHHDRCMEARVSRLEEDMREVKTSQSRVEAAIIRIETALATTLPHLATKADIARLDAKLADKLGKAYMWGILAVCGRPMPAALGDSSC
jgi:hypothetical protein